MYCSIEDMVNRFDVNELIQLTSSNSQGVINQSVIEAAIRDASNLIDGYISGRYTLPLSNVPAVLTKICADLARYNLYDNAVSEVVEKNYKAALDFLMNVGKGTLKLGLSSDSQAPASDESIEMSSSGTVFGRADSKGFI
ncbi:phage protein Gp36 family protein [uncultured Paraglaciecola sp.]|mgnify:CR=1 FL=1|uniref:gp436 family protein n=1 Tax=uncultured Paraglaciecola sp. TaxID=1765024 RepID=UPI002612D1CB|nr:phage protein Gp36 family protein [uncultured Paraglaciecola sp.]